LSRWTSSSGLPGVLVIEATLTHSRRLARGYEWRVIRVTLWASQAWEFRKYTKKGSPNPNPVVEITAVVRTFGGRLERRSANARSTRILGDSPEARELIEWFKAGGESVARPLGGVSAAGGHPRG
jgi:hypothetical protein